MAQVLQSLKSTAVPAFNIDDWTKVVVDENGNKATKPDWQTLNYNEAEQKLHDAGLAKIKEGQAMQKQAQETHAPRTLAKNHAPAGYKVIYAFFRGAVWTIVPEAGLTGSKKTKQRRD